MEHLTFFQFNAAGSRMHKEEDGLYRHLARHFGLSECRLWILYTLEASPEPVTQTELCDYLSLSKQTVNSGLKQLEQEGTFAYPTDPGGGSISISPTWAGRWRREPSAPFWRRRRGPSSAWPRRNGPVCWPWRENISRCCPGKQIKSFNHPRRNRFSCKSSFPITSPTAN